MRSSPAWLCAWLAASLAVFGCNDVAGFEGTATMLPGQDCLQCHQPGGAASFHAFSVAGTIFPSSDSLPDQGLDGAEILVTDATGKKLTLRSNGAGNFYTAEPLQPPLQVAAQWGRLRVSMFEPPPSGACNSCHQFPGPQLVPGFAAPPGRLFVPTSHGDGG